MFGWDETRQAKIICQWHALRNLRKAVWGREKKHEHHKVKKLE